MNPILKRFFGLSFIIFAVIGILISLFCIYGVWRIRSAVLNKFSETTELINASLSATYDGLSVVDKILVDVMDTIDSSENVMVAMSQTIGDINNLTSGFLGALKLRLPGMQQSDNSLDNTADNFAVFETELENIASSFSQVNDAMTEAQGVMGDYQDTIVKTKDLVLDFQINGPKWVTVTSWVLTILLVWFAITQVGFIIQGLEFLRAPQEQKLEAPIESRS
jgi:methyl-accepting chemotaxis protein